MDIFIVVDKMLKHTHITYTQNTFISQIIKIGTN